MKVFAWPIRQSCTLMKKVKTHGKMMTASITATAGRTNSM